MIETSVGVGDAHVFGLSRVDDIAQNPAAVPAMRIHTLSAEVTLQAGSNTRDDNSVSDVKLQHSRSHILNDTNALVTEYASIGHCWKIALQNVKIGSADR